MKGPSVRSEKQRGTKGFRGGGGLSLTRPSIDVARISRDRCITPGGPDVRWPQATAAEEGKHGEQMLPHLET